MATAKTSQQNSGREKLAQAYQLAGEAASETAEHLKKRAATTLKTGKQQANNLEKRAEDTIKAHPVLSVGCAFAVGWVIAKLLK
ncbi:hypothetical protein [Microbulbifer thermotolerans]|uniref:DUF883 domain-containing protein n=1 Tax=Microbulbifer thermotolerans TaxID=252514 RepID=A0A143HJR6_MICTH|nr:hypothetical protein [Microbulbifer thermotolerans]AMX01720.1 hypothetical protein A3224_03200 [Microbulbifer thermotolerans]MCX2779490.1 hypothetical protein [Microbulbifer thermotolerans]MCX2783323.1 hypothetical protein [Microbulbifer thermotolerans]MCX2793361.1 hypothetical protein [Microbulbifer thermotolerans]MCX2801300.1 hypothetical protein [Microbulbifer thermotolerans]